MDLNKLSLEDSPLNIACDTIIEAIDGLYDNAGVKIFNRVERGLYFPIATPLPSEIPCCTLWHEKEVEVSDAEQFGTSEGEAEVSIYLYYYSFGKDETATTFIDIQRIRNNIVRKVLKCLSVPDDNEVSGINPSPFWQFVAGQEIPIEHLNYFRDYREKLIAVVPPWYVDKITLKIWYWNTLPQNYLDSLLS